MSTEDRFKQSVIATLAKRAGNQCANPGCGTLTSGPTSEPTGSVNLGEAAHIYGANPGSARYDEKMESSERSAITNAIWLCGNCHKLVDDDPGRYPAGLLFEWQREHDKRISDEVGKAAAEVRHRYEKRHLEEFGKLSYVAERLIIEKDPRWEYWLTAEVMRFEIAPLLQRWEALKLGLYAKPLLRVNKDDSSLWFSDKLHEIQLMTDAFDTLTNFELVKTWGEPGVTGSDVDIVRVCRLFAELCSSSLLWEESIRFARVDDAFSELLGLCVGVAGSFIEQTAKIPKFLTEVLEPRPASGSYSLMLTVTLPDGWGDRFVAAMQRAERSLLG